MRAIFIGPSLLLCLASHGVVAALPLQDGRWIGFESGGFGLYDPNQSHCVMRILKQKEYYLQRTGAPPDIQAFGVYGVLTTFLVFGGSGPPCKFEGKIGMIHIQHRNWEIDSSNEVTREGGYRSKAVFASCRGVLCDHATTNKKSFEMSLRMGADGSLLEDSSEFGHQEYQDSESLRSRAAEISAQLFLDFQKSNERELRTLLQSPWCPTQSSSWVLSEEYLSNFRGLRQQLQGAVIVKPLASGIID